MRSKRLACGTGKRWWGAPAVASLVFMLAACSGRDVVHLDRSTSSVSPELSEADVDPGLPTPPSTPAGKQLVWVLEAINERGSSLQAWEIEAHFGAAFISVMTTESILSDFTDLAREAAPLTFLDTSIDTDDTSLLALIDGNRGQMTIGMNIEEETGKIAIIQFIELDVLGF